MTEQEQRSIFSSNFSMNQSRPNCIKAEAPIVKPTLTIWRFSLAQTGQRIFFKNCPHFAHIAHNLPAK